MKLIYSTASPYARSCQILLREAGLTASLIEYSLHPFDNPPALINANPLGKVPCLILDNGDAIFDSEVIVSYIDKTFNQSQLTTVLDNSWKLQTTYSLISGLLDTAVALRQEKLRDEEDLGSGFWRERFYQAINRGLENLNTRMEGVKKDYSVITIRLACLLDYLSFRHPEVELDLSNIKEHFKLAKVRPAFIETEPH